MSCLLCRFVSPALLLLGQPRLLGATRGLRRPSTLLRRRARRAPARPAEARRPRGSAAGSAARWTRSGSTPPRRSATQLGRHALPSSGRRAPRSYATFHSSSIRVLDVFTCCPPAPPARLARYSSSARGMASVGDTSSGPSLLIAVTPLPWSVVQRVNGMAECQITRASPSLALCESVRATAEQADRLRPGRLPARPRPARPLGLRRAAVHRFGDLPRRRAGLEGSGHRRSVSSSSRRWHSPVTIGITARRSSTARCYRRPVRATFYYLQAVFDLLLVTAVVHVTATNGAPSQFAALYILVIATVVAAAPGGRRIAGGRARQRALRRRRLLEPRARRSRSASGCSSSVFAVVALGSAYLSAQAQGGRSRHGGRAGARSAPGGRHPPQHPQRHRHDRCGRPPRCTPIRWPSSCSASTSTRLSGRQVLEPLRTIAPELAEALRARRARAGCARRAARGTSPSAGKRLPIGVTTTYTDGDGLRTDRTATAIFQDISDQKRMEALRLRAERLEGVAELSASLAHEIKNPLASIRSAGRAARRDRRSRAPTSRRSRGS